MSRSDTGENLWMEMIRVLLVSVDVTCGCV